MKNQFTDVINNLINNSLQRVNTCLPAIIETYDSKLKKVSIKPQLNQTINGQELEIPVIENVPLMFPSTSTSIISVPVKKGDGCLVVFSQRSIDSWLSKGGVTTPADLRKFDLSDAIAIPGLFNFKDTGRAITGENIEIYNDEGTVEIQGTEDNAVRFSKLESEFNELNDKYNKLITALNSWVVVPQDGGLSLKTIITANAPLNSLANISSAKVESVTLP